MDKKQFYVLGLGCPSPRQAQNRELFFFMGNLYTHIVRTGNDFRIQILSELKTLYRCKPRDYKRIKELQTTLNVIDRKPPQKPLTDKQLQKKYGLFWKKHKPTGV